jgi:hypothetical protein
MFSIEVSLVARPLFSHREQAELFDPESVKIEFRSVADKYLGDIIKGGRNVYDKIFKEHIMEEFEAAFDKLWEKYKGE